MTNARPADVFSPERFRMSTRDPFSWVTTLMESGRIQTPSRNGSRQRHAPDPVPYTTRGRAGSDPSCLSARDHVLRWRDRGPTTGSPRPRHSHHASSPQSEAGVF